MTTPKLVEAFYERIWNAGDIGAAETLLNEAFIFRGSLGTEHRGRTAFTDYVLSVRGALANFKCEILECVSEGMQAFAKMRFSGVHTGEFRGYLSTGQNVHWLGAALFHFDENKICELWVLGDLTGLDALLRENQKRNR